MNRTKTAGAKRQTKRGNKKRNRKRKEAFKDTRENFGLAMVKPGRSATGSGLSNCAQVYAKALVNPWGDFDELPCIPATPSDMTYRSRVIHRGTATTGLNGNGFFAWAPGNPTNNVNTLFYTTSAFNGAGFAAAGAGITAAPKLSNTYAAPVFASNPAIQARLVASGLRIRCNANAMIRQGSLLFCRLQDAGSLAGATIPVLSAKLDTVKQTVEASSKEWLHWNYHPEDMDDCQFSELPVDYTVLYTAPSMGVWISGASGSNPISFDWELVEFWEYAGESNTAVLPNVIRSHSDPVGLSRVTEAMTVPPPSLTLSAISKHAASSIIEQMAHSDSAAKTVEDLLGLAGLTIPTVVKLVESLSSFILH